MTIRREFHGDSGMACAGSPSSKRLKMLGAALALWSRRYIGKTGVWEEASDGVFVRGGVGRVSDVRPA